MGNIALTLYYDGSCSICRAQVDRLRGWDKTARLAFIDIAAPEFSPQSLGVGMAALNAEIHGVDAAGKLLVGLDVLIAAYTAVGRGWRVAPLRVRALRPVYAALYRSLARNRYRLSALLNRRPACADGVCRR
ncbi:thiol-disulfide oxidoreductase DCC family protein [Duganella guangzhouensis]|uniref:thiol-disulfide oxidoreductase DCC family protein n=1 Tax=Duganella guangzhouensis TaxID=2666084 RepID=UPI001E634E8E|nr:DCC1-like thiol-disulfide oxidoreductase family protein [Duganella guangzhouensis]